MVTTLVFFDPAHLAILSSCLRRFVVFGRLASGFSEYLVGANETGSELVAGSAWRMGVLRWHSWAAPGSEFISLLVFGYLVPWVREASVMCMATIYIYIYIYISHKDEDKKEFVRHIMSGYV